MIQDEKGCVVSEAWDVVTGYFSLIETRCVLGVYTYGHYWDPAG